MVKLARMPKKMPICRSRPPARLTRQRRFQRMLGRVTGNSAQRILRPSHTGKILPRHDRSLAMTHLEQWSAQQTVEAVPSKRRSTKRRKPSSVPTEPPAANPAQQHEVMEQQISTGSLGTPSIETDPEHDAMDDVTQAESLFDDFDLPDLVLESDAASDYDVFPQPSPDPHAPAATAAGVMDEQSTDAGPAVADPTAGLSDSDRDEPDGSTAPERPVATSLLEELRDEQSTRFDQIEAQLAGLEAAVATASVTPPAPQVDTAAIVTAIVETLRADGQQVDSQRQRVLTEIGDVRDRINDVRRRVDTSTKTVLASTRTVQALANDLVALTQGRSAGTAPAATGSEIPIMVAVALLALSWSMAFYFKTQDLTLTIPGLVLANVAACLAVYINRRRS